MSRRRELFSAAVKATKHLPRAQEHAYVESDLEIEAKVELRSLQQIRGFAKRIREKTDGIVKHKERKRLETVYVGDAKDIHSVFRRQDKTKGDGKKKGKVFQIRSKEEGECIQSPHAHIPVLVRREIKLKHDAKDFERTLEEIRGMFRLGSFWKSCVDVEFDVDGQCFKATVSLVDRNQRKKHVTCAQLEIEYVGWREGSARPDLKHLMKTFEKAARIAFGKAQYTTMTKSAWLADGDEEALELLPHYKPVKLQRSTFAAKYRNILKRKKK